MNVALRCRVQFRPDDRYAPERVVTVVARQHDDGLFRSCTWRRPVAVLFVESPMQPQPRSTVDGVASPPQGVTAGDGLDEQGPLASFLDHLWIVADVGVY